MAAGKRISGRAPRAAASVLETALRLAVFLNRLVHALASRLACARANYHPLSSLCTKALLGLGVQHDGTRAL